MDRYIRNIQLQDFGIEGQRRLSSASALVVGCGALGTVVAMYLAGAGVGRIVLVDFDLIDITNLQRQISFTEADVSRPKVLVLAEKLHSINSSIEVEAIDRKLSEADSEELLGRCDILMECTDNPAAKYMLTDVAERLGRPYVLGAVAQYRGQVMAWQPGSTRYRDVFPDEAAPGSWASAAQGGVLGTVPGIGGSIQATEAIKMLARVGQPLLNRLLCFDALTMSFTSIDL